MGDLVPDDCRDFSDAAALLRHFVGDQPMRLLTNNPKKIVGLEGYGLRVVDRFPIEIPTESENKEYMRCKRDKMGHILELYGDSTPMKDVSGDP